MEQWIPATGGQDTTALPGTVFNMQWNKFTVSYSQKSSEGRTIAEYGRKDNQGACDPSVLRKGGWNDTERAGGNEERSTSALKWL